MQLIANEGRALRKTSDMKSRLQRDGVKDYHCHNAAELLKVLSPRYERLWKREASAWIFRGQANAEWELQPTAVRDPDPFSRYGIPTSVSPPGCGANASSNWSIRRNLLKELLLRFREGLDRSGLVIPVCSPRISGSEMMGYFIDAAPPFEAFPLMALAQHHGLPTLLLDWTRRALVAAYFAAIEAADKDKRDKGWSNLAVWALFRGGPVDPNGISLIYEVPGGTNPNLFAQNGLFTLHFGYDDPSLEQHLLCLKKANRYAPDLRRITLPISEAGRLLRLLSEEGIDGASMFPGPDGVVRGMREKVLWE